MIDFSVNDILKQNHPLIVCPIALDGVYGNKVTDQCLFRDDILAKQYYELQKLDMFNEATSYKIVFGKEQSYCLLPVKQNADDEDFDFDLIANNLKLLSNFYTKLEEQGNTFIDIAIPQFANEDDWAEIQTIIEQYFEGLKTNCYIYLLKNRGRKYAVDRRKKKPTKKEWNLLRNM